MKTLIIIIATIVLGVVIWGFILSTDYPLSLRNAASNLLKKGVEQMDTLKTE